MADDRSSVVRRRSLVAVAVAVVVALLVVVVVSLVRSDEAGATLVKDIAPGEESGYPFNLVALGDTVYFFVDSELWRSDGTTEGTIPVAEIPASGEPGDEWVMSYLVAAEETLYFWHWDRAGEHGSELWRSDGTAEGTDLVVELPRRGQIPSAGAITPVGNVLYFLYDDGTEDEYLWTSDGTAAGTQPVAPIGIGVRYATPREGEIVAAGDTLYFGANADGVGFMQLWRSDGMSDRVELVVDTYPLQKVAVGDALYFATPVSDTGYELWRTDGTPDGTRSVMDLGNSTQIELAAAGDGIYILAPRSEESFELWWSDGTAAGTRQLSDFPENWSLSRLVVVGDRVYFLAQGDTDGSEVELWRSDGTAEGTRRVGKTGLTVVWEVEAAGDALFFVGDDGGKHGYELWSYEISREEA